MRNLILKISALTKKYIGATLNSEFIMVPFSMQEQSLGQG